MTDSRRSRKTTADRSKSTSAFRRAAALGAVLAFCLASNGPTPSWAGGPKAADGGSEEVAILAGGCFWGMEQLLRELDGVVDTEVGYTADRNDPHSKPAESVRVVFDTERISYEAILRYYFRIHDPTTKNRQGNDRGAEYRSAIFVLDDGQRKVAERVRSDVAASGFWKKPLVTQISDPGPFEVAPEHHQDYLVKHPDGYTCHYERGE